MFSFFFFFFPFAECVHSMEGFLKKKKKRQQTFMAPSCQKPQNAWGCLSSCKCRSHFPVVYVLINQVSDSSQSISLSISQERRFGVSKVTQQHQTYPGTVRCKGLTWAPLPLKSAGFYFNLAQFKVRKRSNVYRLDNCLFEHHCQKEAKPQTHQN